MIESVYDVNNLYDSFILSQSGSNWKSSVQKYEADLLRYSFKTKNHLKDGTYRQKPFYEFDLNERGKMRHIKSLHISDRVVQRSFCDNVLTQVTEDKLIYDNGASVINKGISFARKRISIHLRKYYEKYKTNEGYILQIDFKKFFDSIPHRQLKDFFKGLLDENEYKLFSSLIQTFVVENNEVSVGIGSQISQVCGVFYPTPLDNYCKVVRGCKFYGRYMDDTYIIHRDKAFLESVLKDYLSISEKLGLTVNLKKTHIVKLSHGFTFLKIKYNLFEDGTIIRRLSRSTITRERRKLKKYRKMMDDGRLSLEVIVQAYQSWRGTNRRFNSHTTIRSMDKLFNSLFGGIYYDTGKKRRYQRKNFTVEMRSGRQARGVCNRRLEAV